MLVLTAELSAILKSKLQAGSSGFRARIEIDYSAEPGPVGDVQNLNIAANVYNDPNADWPFTGPVANIHDGSLETTALGGATVVMDDRYHYVALISDLGVSRYVDSMQWDAYGGESPQETEYSEDAVTWTAAPVSWSTDGGSEQTNIGIVARYWRVRWWVDLADGQWGAYFGWPDVREWQINGRAIAAAGPLVYPPLRISIDKSIRMASDQATVELANEDQAFGWGPSAPVATNARMRVYQWYGSADNEVRTFTGVLDSILHGRDPLTVTLKARDMMAIMLDQGFTTIGPQGADEEGKIRTTANGVYLSMEVSAIVEDILLRAGWPQADTSITPTSYVLDEFIIQDGSSWADAIIGDDRLTGLVGYNAWADEDGVFHFEPSELEASATEILSPSYTFRTGEDIVQLANEIDQYDLRTRVKVRGPLTTQELSDTWRELWRTRKLAHPVGVWYDPSNSGYIRVLDRGTKRLYKLRQSDRVLVSSVYVGSICPYPLAVSGDPANSAYYYLLNCPWKFGGSLGGNSIKKIRKSDNKVLSSWSIPSGRWTGMKVSSNYIWLTNWDTDRFYKRSKADASAIASYSHTYGGNEQHNPSGLMIDGTTLNLFWANGGTTARFLQASESAPGTVTKKVKTAGTTLHGGEMDTTTHTECWGVNDSTGVTAKFTLIKAEDHTTEVYAEVIDSELEDELGVLAQLEDRIHDAHSGDPAHPFEVRRDTLDVTVITSLAQATETAMRRLDSLARRRDVVDAGIVGNPALQKTDVVRVLDPKVDSARDYVIDTYRTEMDASGTYLGTLALIPIAEVTDDPVDEGDIESGPEIVPMPITLTFVVTSPIDPDSSVRYWPMLALTSS